MFWISCVLHNLPHRWSHRTQHPGVRHPHRLLCVQVPSHYTWASMPFSPPCRHPLLSSHRRHLPIALCGELSSHLSADLLHRLASQILPRVALKLIHILYLLHQRCLWVNWFSPTCCHIDHNIFVATKMEKVFFTNSQTGEYNWLLQKLWILKLSFILIWVNHMLLLCPAV